MKVPRSEADPIDGPLLRAAQFALSATAGKLLGGASALVVIAAHPGDEILGCAALIHGAGRAGMPIRIVCLTGGTAPATTRQDDTAALSRLAPTAELHWIGEPERMLPLGGRPFDLLVSKIAAHLSDEAMVLLPWRDEPHSDRQRGHDIGRAAMGETHRALSYPLAGRFRPAAPPPSDMRLLSAPPAALAAKRRALGCCRSLSTNPLPEIAGAVPPLREHFLVHPEIFVLD